MRTYPKFVNNYHKKIELLFGQIPFALSLENTGKVRADHINIDIQIVGGWFNAKPIFASLRPSAPKIENSLLHSLLPPFIPPPSRTVGRHEVEADKPRRSAQFSAQCEDFRQGQNWRFSGVVWLDPYQEREAVIIVKITAANLHGENPTLFKLDKSVRCSQVLDLVDRTNGRAVKTYHIKALVEEAIKNSKFDALEWDRIPDDN